jgi:hypothetical protein
VRVGRLAGGTGAIRGAGGADGMVTCMTRGDTVEAITSFHMSNV